jgi:hypothetical protein
VLSGDGHHRAVHVIDLCRATALQVLQHRCDVVGRPEAVVDLTHEVVLEGHTFRCGNGDAFIDD